MQTLILWALFAKGGEAYAKDIKPEVKKKDREALVHLGLVATEKRKNANLLAVTDKGWAWAADHLDAPLPSRSTAGAAILQCWLTYLRAYLRAKEIPLSDFFSPEAGVQTASPAVDGASLRDR